jgi:PAS domain S-box-containing protein
MKNFRLATIRIPLIYAIFSLFWILFTDQLLLVLVPDIERVTQWQTYKGWLFVCLSTLIIYWLIARSAQRYKAAQDALSHSEQLYRLLFNNNPLPMWVYDSTTLAFLEVNEAVIDKYQYTRAEFLNLTLKDIRPPEDIPLLLADVAQTTQSLNFAGEWRHQRKDGTVFPVEIISHSLVYNGRSARLVVAKDLTEQKKLEEERTYVLQRNQSLVAALGEIVYEWFPASDEVRWEGDYGRILGYSVEEMGNTAAKWQGKIHPDDQTRVQQAVDRATKERQNLEIEYRFLKRDGSYCWMLDRGVLNLNEQGELEKVVGVFLDVNERKRTEEALRQSEDRFRKAIEFAPFPIMIHAENGDVLAISQTWLNITGYRLEEIPTIAEWTKRAYGTEQAQVMAGIDQLYDLNERVDEGEFFITCKDGTQRIWEFSSTPLGTLPDGRRGVISIAVDMTERRNVEKQAHLQSSALNAAANGIVITDINGLVEWANPAFTELTGYTLDEALGKNPRDLVRSGKHDRAFFKPLWDTILGGNVWRGEVINRRKDGSTYFEEEAITPVWNADGIMTHFIAIKQDITKRKQAEKEREQFHRQERLAAIGHLAAGIAHDFNNLMAVVLLYSQLLSHSPRLIAKERMQLQIISQQAKRATRLIEQILDFSRRAVFERRPLDLLRLLTEEVTLLQRTLPENIELELVHAADNFVILADETRMQQTIMNLAFNARDAMPQGGSLQFELAHLHIGSDGEPPLPTMQPGNWIHLAVADTGTGIDPAVLDHIFEPFTTTKAPGKGTGLGLSQVHGIVAQHEGFITVNSHLGKGTTFDLYLPAVVLNVDALLNDVPGTAVSGHGERLLVVEDESDLRNALVESLSLWQYEVVAAANGEEALALLEKGTAVDLILCDVIMPKMGGIPFVQALQKLEQKPPVIFITGHPLDNAPESLHALGVYSILSKPIQPDQLSHTIAAALER